MRCRITRGSAEKMAENNKKPPAIFAAGGWM
jgi:hypothetical protein